MIAEVLDYTGADAIIRGMTTRQKLTAIMQERGVSEIELSRLLGVTSTLVYRWTSINPQHQNMKPNPIHLLKIARHFGVTMESMIDPEMAVQHGIPADEQFVLDTYRQLRETAGLTPAQATIRLSTPLTPQLRPYAHPDSAKGSQ